MTIRTYRVCLDPTMKQAEALSRHCGTNRVAFNFALARKREAYDEFVSIRANLVVDAGLDPEDKDVLKEFDKQAGQLAVDVPKHQSNMPYWRSVRDKVTDGVKGPIYWWREVDSKAIWSGMNDADAAWKNWLDSRTGKRAGGPMGFPRFKKKGRARDSFKLFDISPIPDARHLILPEKVAGRTRRIRLHSNLRRLCRLQAKGMARITSVTIAREADRWFASVCVDEVVATPVPTKRQVAAGVVGVDLGVTNLAAFSDGRFEENDRLGKSEAKRLARAQRRLARTQKGSARHKRAVSAVARIQARTAERRKQRLHLITKKLATGFAAVAVEDLDVSGMTASARGTVEEPGKNVKQKAGLNREILDVSFGEFRRQLEYKTERYGSQLAVVGRFEPTSKKCSRCGNKKEDLARGEQTYVCSSCGLVMNRDLNAAVNIAALGTDQLNAEAPDGQRYRMARLKPSDRCSAPTSSPDSCGSGDPEASYRVLMEDDESEVQKVTGSQDPKATVRQTGFDLSKRTHPRARGGLAIQGLASRTRG